MFCPDLFFFVDAGNILFFFRIVENTFLHFVLQFLGSPTEDDLGSLNESGKQYLRMIPSFDRQSFLCEVPRCSFLSCSVVGEDAQV